MINGIEMLLFALFLWQPFSSSRTLTFMFRTFVKSKLGQTKSEQFTYWFFSRHNDNASPIEWTNGNLWMKNADEIFSFVSVTPMPKAKVIYYNLTLSVDHYILSLIEWHISAAARHLLRSETAKQDPYHSRMTHALASSNCNLMIFTFTNPR